MNPTQKYRITRIGKKDAFYDDRKRLIGQEGTVQGLLDPKERGWYSGDFQFDETVLDKLSKTLYFFLIQLKKL